MTPAVVVLCERISERCQLLAGTGHANCHACQRLVWLPAPAKKVLDLVPESAPLCLRCYAATSQAKRIVKKARAQSEAEICSSLLRAARN
jgi:hypothetical protein